MTDFPFLFRPEPKIAVQNMQTYAISAPKATHTRVASCEEVRCRAFEHGWITNVDTSTDLGKKQSYYLRNYSGRHFALSKAGPMETYEFGPGNDCFTEHRVGIDRPSLYIKRGGDWRATTSPAQVMKPADWVDDFAETQDKIATAQRRG